jgi:hypothetical protein
MSRLESCPHCLTEVRGWATACPKCRYHPDFYNRAQDDVAMIFQLGESDCADRCAASSGSTTSWLSWLPWRADKHPPRPTA